MSELPETTYVLASAGDRWSEPYVTSMDGYSAEQMQDYARQAVAAAMERAAQIADKYAKRDFPWGSENADRYHAQADWAELIAAAIRKEPQ